MNVEREGDRDSLHQLSPCGVVSSRARESREGWLTLPRHAGENWLVALLRPQGEVHARGTGEAGDAFQPIRIGDEVKGATGRKPSPSPSRVRPVNKHRSPLLRRRLHPSLYPYRGSMRHIVAFSGGLSSFEVARLLVEQHGKDVVECVFTDTATEDDDLYRFVRETRAYLGCAFTHLADGRNIWEVFESVSFMGNSRIDPCSRILKREIFAQYLKRHYPDPIAVTLYYGIQSHEKHRIEDIRSRWAPYPVEAPLIALETTKEQMMVTLDQIGIALPLLYELGFEHNNCGGFCVKTGQRQMAHLLKVMPARYHWHEERQEKLFERIGPHGFIRKTTNGELRYLSLKEFREMLESGEKPQMFQDGACACFS